MAVWLAISGGKNVGKTSVIEQLIGVLKPLGYRIATVKHTHLQVDGDLPGTDTYRHRHAGADTTVLVSPKGYFLHHPGSGEERLPDGISRILSEFDVVLCEGFYDSDIPKVVIESMEEDEKTTSAPGEPVILRTRLQRSPEGELSLSPSDLDRIISYIGERRKHGEIDRGMKTGSVQPDY